jgi:hypothetical protein
MAADECGCEFFYPFKKNSVTVVSAPTNTGKTFLVTHLIKLRKIFFANNPISRVVVVLCNSHIPNQNFNQDFSEPKPPTKEGEKTDDEHPGETLLEKHTRLLFAPRVPSPPQSDIEVVYLRIEELVHPNDFFQEGDVVIFEDVQNLTQVLLDTINVSTHHLNLCATFVLCQRVLGTDLFSLIGLVHNVLLLCGSNGVTRFANYLVQNYYHDLELKDRLKSVISYAQKHQHTVWLEINSLGGNPSPHLAISAIEQIFPHKDNIFPHCLVYPQPNKERLFASAHSDNFVLLEADMPVVKDFPPESYILVPAKHVTQKRRSEDQDENGESGKPKCARRDQWEYVNREIEKMIQNTFDPKKWKKARNLASEILKNPDFCISDDARLLLLKTDKSQKMGVSLMDFLIQCLRQQGPAERPGANFGTYANLVQMMLDSATPAGYFNNRALLNPSATLAAQRQNRKRKISFPGPFGPPRGLAKKSYFF